MTTTQQQERRASTRAALKTIRLAEQLVDYQRKGGTVVFQER
jgi:hypothetical protein